MSSVFIKMVDCPVGDVPAKLMLKKWQYFGLEIVVDENGIMTLNGSKMQCKVCLTVQKTKILLFTC